VRNQEENVENDLSNFDDNADHNSDIYSSSRLPERIDDEVDDDSLDDISNGDEEVDDQQGILIESNFPDYIEEDEMDLEGSNDVEVDIDAEDEVDAQDEDAISETNEEFSGSNSFNGASNNRRVASITPRRHRGGRSGIDFSDNAMNNVRLRIESMPHMLDFMEVFREAADMQFGNNSSSHSANLDIMTRLVPHNPLSTSSRLGNSFTLSFGTTGGGPGGGMTGINLGTINPDTIHFRRPNLMHSSGQLSHPPSHPLLSMSNSRRIRPNPSMQNSGRTMIATFLSDSRDPFICDHRQQQRNNFMLSPRRRALGPIVSDRRWGTDVGEIEQVGSRLSILFSAVENSIEQKIVRPYSNLSEKVKSLLKGASEGKAISILEDRIIGIESHPDCEESKEEGVLQETKDGDEEPIAILMSESSEIQLSNTENEFEFREPNLVTSLLVEDSVVNATFEESLVLPLNDNIIQEPESSSVSQTIIAPTSAVSSISTLSETNSDNIAFIESLSGSLRQEVLLTSDDIFLSTLSTSLRDEVEIFFVDVFYLI
jgi:hypothetical protein